MTDAGRHFFEHIKMALDHFDSAVTSAGMAGRVEKGSLKIGLFSSLASGFLPELLRCYSARHPEVDVSIVEGPPSENLARLRAEQLDIAFVMDQPVVAPLLRLITSCEIGRTALLLATDYTTAVTGEVFYVDGGFHIEGMVFH